MSGEQRKENCYSRDLKAEGRPDHESLRKWVTLLLEHRSYGIKGCCRKRSCRDSLLMDKSLLWRMDDKRWAQWKGGSVGEMVGDSGVLFGSKRAIGFSSIRVPRTLCCKGVSTIDCHQHRFNFLHKVQGFLTLTVISVHLDFWKYLEGNALGHTTHQALAQIVAGCSFSVDIFL